MGLMLALNAAMSGLRVTQAGIDLVSQNVANANAPGYSRRVMTSAQLVAGDRTVGVRAGAVERALDLVAQRQLRLERAGAAYTSLVASYASQIDKLFGAPGGAGALDTLFNTFTQSLQGLLADPGGAASRNAVLENARVLASQIGRIAESVQALRTDAEARIGKTVERANALLSGIAEVNTRIVASGATPDPALLDERDRMTDELSGFMDVRVTQNRDGSVSLATTGGFTLFNGIAAVHLSFDGRAALSPQSRYSTDPALRGVGTITATSANGVTVDLIGGGLIRSGALAAAIEMRDRTLVEAQRQLDELAAGMSRALSDRRVEGQADTLGGETGFRLDLAGIQPGNGVTLDVTVNGQPRRVLLIATNGGAPTIPPADAGDPNAVVVTFNPADLNAAAGAIRTALAARGINLNIDAPSATALRIVGDTPALTAVRGASAAITATGLIGGVELPLFVDSGHGNAPFTGSFEGGSRLTGFAQRMAVNPALLADRQRLVVYAAGVAQGDTARPQALLDSLTRATRSFGAAAGLNGDAPFSASVAEFSRRVVEDQGANAESAERLDEGQKVALAAIESRFQESAGVTIDEEMAQLVMLQTAYGANARIMTAVRDMMDLLMRM